MKSKKYWNIAIIALVLTACSKEQHPELTFANDLDAIHFTANASEGFNITRSNPLGQMLEQRTVFNSGDQIKVSTGYKEVTYTFNGSRWIPAGTDYLFWSGLSMEIYAQYPPSIPQKDGEFVAQADQSEYHTGTDKDIALADYMTFRGTISNQQGAPVNLRLQRRTARVIVSIASFGDQFATNSKVSDVKIYSRKFASPNNVQITPYQTGDGSAGTRYTALVYPTVGPTDKFITLKVGNEELTVTGIPFMKAGNSYTYHLTVGKSSPGLRSGEVKSWNTPDVIEPDTDGN